MNNKIMSLVGFGLKARKVVCGTNAISCSRNVLLMFLCHSASENTKKEALKMARRFKVPLIISKDTLIDDIVHKNNCKMFAVLDKGFKNAILNNLDDSLEIIFRGVDGNERD